MKKLFLKIDFKWFPLALIVAYVPFHILEEALGNFPLWMSEHYNLPTPLSYPHWLINNSFFLLILLVGLYIFNRNWEKNLMFGVGILFWGFMNSMEHIIFSAIDLKVSPGFYSAIIFLIIFVLGVAKLKQLNIFKFAMVLKSIMIALMYWVLAFSLIVSLGTYMVKAFPFST